VIGVVDRTTRKGRQVVSCCAAVAVVGNRYRHRRIDPDRGQRRVFDDRNQAVGVVDLAVHAGTPADEDLLRRRCDGGQSKRFYLRLASRTIRNAIHGRSAGGLAETIGNGEVFRTDPNGVQHHVLVDLHAGVKQNQRAALHD